MATLRIEIEFPLHDESSRRKAIKKASEMDGVLRVEVVRERNLLVVSGIGVDCVELTNTLRKRFRSARVVSVRAINPEQEAGFYQRDFSDRTFYDVVRPIPAQCYYEPAFTYTAIPVYERDPPPCSIM